MTQSQVVLRGKDQQRLAALFTSFAKSDPTLLKYSQVLFLLLERSIFSNKFTLVHFHRLFEEAIKVKPTKPTDKTDLNGERFLARQQLIFLLHEAAKIIFKADPQYHTRFYNKFLSETRGAEGEEIQEPRVLVFDEANRKILIEGVLNKITQYDEDITNIFMAYIQENQWSLKKNHRILLNLREIILQNKSWNYCSTVAFLKDSDTSPQLIAVEQFEEIQRLIVPSINSKQHQFYSRRTISEGYHKGAENFESVYHLGDPGITLYELQIMFVRMAWEAFGKNSDSKDPLEALETYFKYLFLRNNDQLASVPLPNVSRKMIVKMKEFYKIINETKNIQRAKNEGTTKPVNQAQLLSKKMSKEIIQAPDLGTDVGETLKILDRELPKMPPLPKVVPQYTKKFDKNDGLTIGQQPPPESPEEQLPKIEKKGNDKNDEQPMREYKWAQEPQIKLRSEDYFKIVEQKLNFEVKPLDEVERGTVDREAYPSILGEVLFPPTLPKAIVSLLEMATRAMGDGNYLLAMENYTQAQQTWKKSGVEVNPSIELYFQYCRGYVYLRAGRFEYALVQFYTCRKHTQSSKMPFTNPDRSLPFFGLGEVFYEIEEYELSARSFLKARQIREGVLGLQNVQTATVFNNLACAFFMLRRSQQALGYIQIAEVILDTELGARHPRTMTCRTNLGKVQRGDFQSKPQFRRLWEAFEEDKFEKKKNKKEKKEDSKKK